jgi:serine/threonine protein kinase
MLQQDSFSTPQREFSVAAAGRSPAMIDSGGNVLASQASIGSLGFHRLHLASPAILGGARRTQQSGELPAKRPRDKDARSAADSSVCHTSDSDASPERGGISPIHEEGMRATPARGSAPAALAARAMQALAEPLGSADPEHSRPWANPLASVNPLAPPSDAESRTRMLQRLRLHAHGDGSSFFSRMFDEVGVAGRGSFCEVVRARSRIDGAVYAVKRALADRADDAEAATDLISEVRALAMSGPHPHVIGYHNAWRESDDDSRPPVEGDAQPPGRLFVQLEAAWGNLMDALVGRRVDFHTPPTDTTAPGGASSSSVVTAAAASRVVVKSIPRVDPPPSIKTAFRSRSRITTRDVSGGLDFATQASEDAAQPTALSSRQLSFASQDSMGDQCSRQPSLDDDEEEDVTQPSYAPISRASSANTTASHGKSDIRSFLSKPSSQAQAAVSSSSWGEENSNESAGWMQRGTLPSQNDDEEEDDEDKQEQGRGRSTWAHREDELGAAALGVFSGGTPPPEMPPMASQMSFHSVEGIEASQSAIMGRDDLRSDGSRLARLRASPLDIRLVALHLARALSHLHCRALAHMDLKPRNILIVYSKPLFDGCGHYRSHARELSGLPSSDLLQFGSELPGGRPVFKLADLGRCTRYDDRSARDGDSQYLAPETLNPLPTTDHRCADMFALGLMLLEMVIARPLPRRGFRYTSLRRCTLAARRMIARARISSLRQEHDEADTEDDEDDDDDDLFEDRQQESSRQLAEETTALEEEASRLAGSSERDACPPPLAHLILSLLQIHPSDRPTASDLSSLPFLCSAEAELDFLVANPTQTHFEATTAMTPWFTTPLQGGAPRTAYTTRSRPSMGAVSDSSFGSSGYRRASMGSTSKALAMPVTKNLSDQSGSTEDASSSPRREIPGGMRRSGQQPRAMRVGFASDADESF